MSSNAKARGIATAEEPFTDAGSDEGSQETWLKLRDRTLIETTIYEELPPVPRIALVEVANICNHSCTFCAYSEMTRPHRAISPELFRRVMTQAYELGVREAGLHSGAEPLTCRWLDKLIGICVEIGYEYIYLTTNGTLGTEARLKSIIDAGLSSIKFSINGGDRETYHRIHGKDHFERALENLRFVAEYRKSLSRPLFLAVSFVETKDNAASLPAFRNLVEGLVDEIYVAPATNQSGQTPGLPMDETQPAICVTPFNQLNVTSEGYLRICCNDYQNMLAVEDLNKVSLKEAWSGERARTMRRRHIAGELEGTLCHNCMHGCQDPIRPLNPALGSFEAIAKITTLPTTKTGTGGAD